MTRRTTRTTKATPAEGDLKVTPEEGKIESPVTEVKASDPVNLEVETKDEEPVAPAPATAPEKLQTDFREKLANKNTEDNVFVPSNPVALEKAAAEVAKDQGFEFNRGTSVGARLMARAQKRF
jgi:hypothetical protein